jgi:hypothetical protein
MGTMVEIVVLVVVCGVYLREWMYKQVMIIGVYKVTMLVCELVILCRIRLEEIEGDEGSSGLVIEEVEVGEREQE